MQHADPRKQPQPPRSGKVAYRCTVTPPGDLLLFVATGNVGAEAVGGGLVGVVRSEVVSVEGLPPLAVEHGEFELFPRVPADARRMRYRLWLRDPGGARWFLRGNQAGGQRGWRRAAQGELRNPTNFQIGDAPGEVAAWPRRWGRRGSIRW